MTFETRQLLNSIQRKDAKTDDSKSKGGRLERILLVPGKRNSQTTGEAVGTCLGGRGNTLGNSQRSFVKGSAEQQNQSWQETYLRMARIADGAQKKLPLCGN